MPRELSPLEQMCVDVARAAITGDADGARVLVRRATRRSIDGATHPGALKEALLELLDLSSPVAASPLRGSSPVAAPPENAWVTQVDAPTAEPILPPPVADAIEMLVAEHSAAESLGRYGLSPARTVLFTGPPGVGKTLTAAHVAARLGHPLVTVNFATLISSLMGQTGSNFQSVVDAALEAGAVLFLDEFDAIGKSRGDMQDLGEMKRVVNVVLQQLDAWPAHHLLIAATNHPELLDPAVFRRFDAAVAFTPPGPDELRRYLAEHPVLERLQVASEVRDAIAAVGPHHTLSTLDSWVRQATRNVIVNGDPERATQLIFDLVSEDARTAAASSPAARADLSRAAKAVGWTQRKTAEWLGVSHVTIGNDLRGS